MPGSSLVEQLGSTAESATTLVPNAGRSGAARVLWPGAGLPLDARRLARLGSQGFWAIADQGLFAVSNLLVNVLLARGLAPAEYGAFATAYTVLLLVTGFHSALLIEPMLVF